MIEIKADELILKYAIANCSILELGNQIMNLEKVQDVSAKIYYSNKGFRHTSIDKNGLNGALPFDLCIPVKLDNQFDLVTDIGTSEHVEDLFNCLLNVFNFCEDEGIMIHKNPKTGNFPEHGFHYYTVNFWKEYADMCGFEIIELFEYPIYHNTDHGWEIIAVLRKTNKSKALTKSGFNKISKHIFPL